MATSEVELQELVDRLDWVSHEYSLLINVDKTKVMASDGIVYHILIQNEQLEQMDTFPFLTVLVSGNRRYPIDVSSTVKQICSTSAVCSLGSVVFETVSEAVYC